MNAERGLTVDHSTIAPWVLPLRSGAERAYSIGNARAQSVVAGRWNLHPRRREVDVAVPSHHSACNSIELLLSPYPALEYLHIVVEGGRFQTFQFESE